MSFSTRLAGAAAAARGSTVGRVELIESTARDSATVAAGRGTGAVFDSATFVGICRCIRAVEGACPATPADAAAAGAFVPITNAPPGDGGTVGGGADAGAAAG